MKHIASFRSSQKGSVHAIVALVIVVAIIGFVGYLFWSKTSAQSVIKYENVEVTSDTDVEELRGAPESFRSFMAERLDTLNAGRDESPPDCFNIITVRKIVDKAYAIGDITVDGEGDECVGMSSEIWAYASDDDTWNVVDITQDDVYSCDKLEEFEVPGSVAGTKCYTLDKELHEYEQ